MYIIVGASTIGLFRLTPPYFVFESKNRSIGSPELYLGYTRATIYSRIHSSEPVLGYNDTPAWVVAAYLLF